jgi:hypothetical protein
MTITNTLFVVRTTAEIKSEEYIAPISLPKLKVTHRKLCLKQTSQWCPWNLMEDGPPMLWKDIVVCDGERCALARDNKIATEDIRYWLSIHHIATFRDGCECG